MSESLTSAMPIDGICGIVDCGDKSYLVCHTFVGLAGDQDGNTQDCNGVGILRIDPRESGPAHTEYVAHEWIHHKHPHWSEEYVAEEARQLAALFHLPEVKRRSFSV